MKTSSANAAPEPPSLQTARGFAATNLALPGFGSLMARRSAGWPQAAFTIVGFGLTTFFGIRFGIWFFKHLDTLYGSEADPIEAMLAVWREMRWALLGMGLFGFSWLWSLATNASILRTAWMAGDAEKPPVLE